MADMEHDYGLLFAIPFVGLMVYLKFRAAKKYSDEHDQKADITSLFDGEK
jgi:hypothetical protein